MMLAIPLESEAVAVRVNDVAVVPLYAGLEEMMIVGAILSITGGVVICSVIVFDVIWLEFVELSVAVAVMV